MARGITIQPGGVREAIGPCDLPCPIERGMRMIGGKWTASILWHLRDGPVRFNDLSRMIAGASKKMLSERLRQLETHGLLTRRPDTSSRVITVSYALTEGGQSAVVMLEALANWADTVAPVEGQSRPDMASAK